MSRRYALYLVVLGAIWGSSYLFIKVGVRDLSPAVLIEIRLLCAAPVLIAFAVRRYGWLALRAAWREGLVLGVLMFISPWVMSYTGLKGITWTSWIIGALTVIAGAVAIPVAQAAHKAKHKVRVVHNQAAVVPAVAADPYAAYYRSGPRPPWAAPWQCFTDEGYGRFRPCDAGPRTR